MLVPSLREEGTCKDRYITEDARIIARAPNCRLERIPERKHALLDGRVLTPKPVVKFNPLCALVEGTRS